MRHATPTPAASRNGQGTLMLLVVSAVVLATVTGMHQHFFGSHVSQQSVRGALGSSATLWAESAVQEALWNFQRQANDPKSKVFEMLRREVYAPHAGALDLGRELPLEELPALLRKPGVRGFSLEQYQVKVAYQRQFEDLPYERFGQLRVQARVVARPATGKPIAREVEISRGFKIALAGVPRPFDQSTLYVGDLSSVTDPQAVNNRRRRYIDDAARVRAALVTAQTSCPAAFAERYTELVGALDTRATMEASVPPLPEDRGSLLYAQWHSGQFFDLENLDLARRLEAEEGRLAAPAARFASAEASMKTTPVAGAAHKELLDASQAFLQVVENLIGRIWAFHGGFRVVPGSDRSFSEIAARHERLGLEHWRRVAFFTLRETRTGPTIDEQFKKLRKSIEPLSGVVLVESSTQALRLAGDFKGKLVIVVTGGGAVLDAVNANDRAQDLLTVISLGGPLTLSGENHAVVVAASPGGEKGRATRPGALTMQPGTILKGGLVLERVPAGSELRGRLRPSSKFFSGTTGKGDAHRPVLDHYVVGLAPVDTFRRVGRQ